MPLIVLFVEMDQSSLTWLVRDDARLWFLFGLTLDEEDNTSKTAKVQYTFKPKVFVVQLAN